MTGTGLGLESWLGALDCTAATVLSRLALDAGSAVAVVSLLVLPAADDNGRSPLTA